MSRLMRLLCLTLLVISCSAVRAWAGPDTPDKPADPAKDVLIFSNGDQLTGTFLRSTGANVSFKSDMAGEITIAWDKIKELRANGHYAVLEKGFKTKSVRKLNEGRIPQGTLTMQDQTIAVQPEAGPPATVSTKETEFVIDSATYNKEVHGHPGFFSNWDGSVTAGATLVRATQDSETYTGALNLIRLAPNVSWLDTRTRDIVNVLETYGNVSQPGADLKTSIFHADAEHDLYFSPRAYALVNTSFDHNYSQGLGLQQIYGAGVGITAIKDAKQQLDMKAQIQYETQSYIMVPGSPSGTPITPSTELVGATFAENYNRKLKNIVLNEQLQLIPTFNVLSDYSAVGQVGAIFPVYKRLSFTANVLDTYLADPAEGAKPNSFQLVTGITYKLK